METYLTIRWSTSRGRDTYGYNICTVTDQETGKKYRCNGGGYDMLGTSVGNWLQDRYQTELLAISHRAYSRYTEAGEGSSWHREGNENGLYGMCYYVHGNRVVLEGACGLSSMETIAKAIGIKLQRTYEGKYNRTTGYIVKAAD
jgi:hypothetical protein